MSASPEEVLTFERLTDEQRAVAWAVVRSVATSLWVAVAVMTLACVFVAANQRSIPAWGLPPLLGATALTVALEVKSRDLEKPTGPTSP